VVQTGDDIAPVFDLRVLDAFGQNIRLVAIIDKRGDQIRRTDIKGKGKGPPRPDIDQAISVLHAPDNARKRGMLPHDMGKPLEHGKRNGEAGKSQRVPDALVMRPAVVIRRKRKVNRLYLD
jgi:hypothetical protein